MRVVVLAGIVAASVAVPGADRQPARSGPPADYPIQAVPVADVRVAGGFWGPRLETTRAVSIPHIMRQNELTGRVANFLKAARRQEGPYQGQRYNDTDVYKVIEAASWSLATHPDAALDRQLDELITIVAAAQESDGYLYTPRTVDPQKPPPGVGPERWSYMHTSHELYNAGHMYEAAVAHFLATGKRTLLAVAIRNADLVCRTFGPDARRETSGHQEIELALVKLYRVTGDRKYLDQARFFLEQRGRPHTVKPVRFPEGDRFFMYNDLAYRQDHLPVVDQTRAVGHAVRATYMFAGMTDVATLFDDAAYARTLDRLFADVTGRRMYITGGLGSVGRTEAFGDDYVLPNQKAYTETCASIGGLLWYHRMFLRTGDAAYLEVLERTLYNGYLSGVSLAGDTFFYQNPLESDGAVERRTYFDVACCPANFARLMTQLPGLVYARRAGDGSSRADPALYVNLFVQSEASVEHAGTRVRIRQETAYPWSGRVTLRIDPAQPIESALAVRVPGWARGEAVPGDLYRFAAAPPEGRAPGSAGGGPVLTVNGEPHPLALDRGFVTISRTWQAGDVVILDLPMPVRRVLAHEGVAENRGKAAIQRGPLVYCLEAVDNGGRTASLRVPLDAALAHEFRGDLLGGVEVVTGRDIAFLAVPYYAWANRGSGQMAVWIPFE